MRRVQAREFLVIASGSDSDGFPTVRGRRFATYARQQAERSGEIIPFQRPFTIPPEILSGYRLLRAIGRGGQGTVYEAIQTVTKRHVAIKVLDMSVGSGVRLREKFEREIEALGRLRHPNIVAVHDGGVAASGYFYIIMDLVDGLSITDYLADCDASIDGILQLFVKICHAVNAAHLHGVVHRDLKPSNILVDADGEPHVLDFGVAKILDDRREDPPGAMVGTLVWASPEQACGKHDEVDVRTDVYSLGVVLFHALTGSMPIRNESVAGGFQKRISRPSQLWSELDDDIDTIVLKCLHSDPAERYQSVADLGRDIEHRLNHEPIEPKRHLRGYVLRCLIRRHTALAVAAVSAFLFLIVFTITVTILYRNATTAKFEAHAQAARAEAALRALQNTSSIVVGRIAPKLKQVPVTSTVKRELLQTAMNAFESLINEGSDDPMLQAERARALVQLGDIALSLDQRDKAMRYRREALAIRERLAAAKLEQTEWREELAVSYVLVGDLLEAPEDQPCRHELYEKTRGIDENLASRFPDNLTYVNNLVFDFERLGNFVKNNGDYTTADSLFAKQHASATTLIDHDPDKPSSQWALLCSLGQLAAMCEQRGEFAQMAAWHLDALAAARRLIELAPDNPDYMKALFATAGSVIADQIGQHPPVDPDSFLELAPILEKYVDMDPDNHDRQRDMASFYLNLSGIYHSLQDMGHSEQFAAKALAVLHRLPDNANDQTDQLRLQLTASHLVAVLAYARGDQKVGAAHAEEAVATANHLEEKLGTDAMTLLGLAELWARCEIAETCDPLRAESLARRSIELSHGALPRSHYSLALALKAQGRIDEARDAAEKTLALLPTEGRTLRVVIENFLHSLDELDSGRLQESGTTGTTSSQNPK